MLVSLLLSTRNDASNSAIAPVKRSRMLIVTVCTRPIRDFRSLREIITVVVIDIIAPIMTGSTNHKLRDWWKAVVGAT